MTRARKVRTFLLLFGAFMVPAAVLFVLGTGAPAQAGGQQVLEALAQSSLLGQGQALYEAHCSSCHGVDAQGSNLAPMILGLGPAYYDFQMSTGRMPLPDPTAQAVRRPPLLSPAQIQAITAYLSSLAPGGVQIPHVDLAAGSLSQGEQIFISNCAPCHSAAGNGGAVGPQLAPNLHQATPTQVAEAVRIGPGTMPIFGTGLVSSQQLNSLVKYVEYLRNPDHPGGISLGVGGPVIEGFVALLLGLGSILVITRVIGERS